MSNPIKTKKLRLPECPSIEGPVVIIDVIRAFTTTAFAFAAGAEKIIMVGDIEEAFRLHREFPETLLAGEQQGIQIPGFHLDNSPVQMENASLKGKTLILRSSSGTQGVVRSVKASKILVSSFAVAEATLRHIHRSKLEEVNFVITGTTKGGFEDLALADYLEQKIHHGFADPAPYIERVRNSPSGIAYGGEQADHAKKQDLEACCLVDKFSFAQEVFKENGLLVLRPLFF